ncbi:MAG: T9SS type A sorting domain-containing protein, partial [Flavobacteriales bacterium]|jgi:hypothetical protein|nr:T9SS type A sorting domain-containing protein [Flavobacteriales bacterium]
VFSTTGSFFMVMTSDAIISCSSGSQTEWQWEVVCLDCEIPTATVSLDEDCEVGEYTIELDITSTGSGATVDLVYSVNGGDPVTETGVGTGITVLGPFGTGSSVDVQLQHESNDLCDLDLGTITDSGDCPAFVHCGEPALQQSYCYVNSDNTSWGYQGVGEGALRLTFTAGSIESATFDHLTIYDGPDATGDQLFNHTQTSQFQLAGLEVFSSTGAFFMVMTSDGSVSCSSGSQTEWHWEVVCLDCAMPQATFAVVQDCENFQYYVDVEVTDMGSEAEWEITNTGGAPAITVDAIGTYQAGPFTSGVPVVLMIQSDVLCVVSSGTLVNPLCPQVVCGATAIEETYCYVANDQTAWAYALPGSTGSLRLTFQRGTIESSTWDQMVIYDGPDATGDVLFSHTNAATSNFGPEGSGVLSTAGNYYAVDVTSTTGNLYMTVSSDGIIQCSTSTNYDPWEWSVFCEGCEAPGVNYAIVADCPYRSYSVEVDVSTAPVPEGLELLNTITGEAIVANAIGTYAFGPYPVDEPAQFEVRSLDNPTCFYESDTLTHTTEQCVIESCGPDNYGYCYTNDEDRWYTYRAAVGQPVLLSFQGGLMLPGDQVVLYNGGDESALVLYQGNFGGDLSGLAMMSQNPDNVLTLRILADATGSCEDGGVGLPLSWTVACGSLGVDAAAEAGISVFPNPTTGLLSVRIDDPAWSDARLRVTDLSGRVVAEHADLLQGGTMGTADLSGLATGMYMVRVQSGDRWHDVRIQVVH